MRLTWSLKSARKMFTTPEVLEPILFFSELNTVVSEAFAAATESEPILPDVSIMNAML